MNVLFIVGFIGFVVGIIALSWWFEKKRTEAMEAYAQSRGFTFEGENPALMAELRNFKLFGQGHSQVVKNAMRGAKDIGAIRICDYTYTTGSGKHRTVHNQTIAVVHTPGRNAPHFFVRRQRALFDSLGKLFGGQDINFDDDPAFSNAYVLQTSGGEQRLQSFMSVGLRETFTRLVDKNLIVEVKGDTLLIHQGKRLKKHEDIDGLVADAVNIRRQWS